MSSARARLQKRTTTLYLLLRMLQAAVLIVYLLASLLLAGGQVSVHGSPIWDAAVDFPLFSLPGWLMLTLSATGVLLAVVVLVLSRVDDAGRVVGAFSATAAATVASFFFAWALPEGSGADLSLRWAAAFTDAAVLLALLVTSGTLALMSDRRRARQGLPLWSGMDDEA
ncbi:hypothetical protein ACWIDW_08795 [Microbacterium sp. NPDC055312]